MSDCLQLLLMLLILFYAFHGYKKPHGNLLKYIILASNVLFLSGINALVSAGAVLPIILGAIGCGLSCYIAGRLNKVKENLVLMIIVTLCIIIGVVPRLVSGFITIGIVSGLITWLDICVAYFLRYKQHRVAGLEDAPKK